MIEDLMRFGAALARDGALGSTVTVELDRIDVARVLRNSEKYIEPIGPRIRFPVYDRPQAQFSASPLNVIPHTSQMLEVELSEVSRVHIRCGTAYLLARGSPHGSNKSNDILKDILREMGLTEEQVSATCSIVERQAFAAKWGRR